MTQSSADPSRFLREALEDGAEPIDLDVEQAQALLDRSLGEAGLSEGTRPSPAAFERLMRTVSVLPDKYAPFFDKLSSMFDVDEATLRRDLERAREPRSWKPSGLPGVRLIPMSSGPRVRGVETALVRFSAGMRFPRHRHRGDEVTLILEGGYVDERGKEYHPGDLDPRSASEGDHSFRTFSHEPCIAATANRGFEFHAWPLRLLAKLAGR